MDVCCLLPPCVGHDPLDMRCVGTVAFVHFYNSRGIAQHLFTDSLGASTLHVPLEEWGQGLVPSPGYPRDRCYLHPPTPRQRGQGLEPAPRFPNCWCSLCPPRTAGAVPSVVAASAYIWSSQWQQGLKSASRVSVHHVLLPMSIQRKKDLLVVSPLSSCAPN